MFEQNGGARRDRTADLLHAMQALSQLSYSPFNPKVVAYIINPATCKMLAPYDFIIFVDFKRVFASIVRITQKVNA